MKGDSNLAVDPEVRAFFVKHVAAIYAEAGGSGVIPPPPPLNPPGGGGSSDGMEARLAKLEAHMEHVHADLAKLADIPPLLATLTERVSHLPTKDELGTKLRNYLVVGGTVFTIIGTLIGLAFKFLGH